jgi:uncharacterized membrane protein YbhN (UPF0104 family)
MPTPVTETPTPTPTDEGQLVRRRPVTALLGAAVGCLAVGIAVLHRTAVSDGVRVLLTANAQWLALAACVVCLTWVSGTCMQVGVLTVRPPLLRLFAVQVAGSFANHVLPAGSGGLAVNLRFLRRFGMSRDAALGSQALSASAGAAMHLALLVPALALAPRGLREVAGTRLDQASDGTPVRLVVAAAALAVAAAILLALRPSHGLRARLAGRAAEEYRALACVAGDPRKAIALWSGALAGPVVHSVVLFAVLQAVDSPLALDVVLPVYLATSALSALVPSPGGVGSLDVALAAGLVTAGLPVASAVAALVAYRCLTVWIPFLPGACTLGVLVKRRIV